MFVLRSSHELRMTPCQLLANTNSADLTDLMGYFWHINQKTEPTVDDKLKQVFGPPE